jgi:5-carboxymethyl-2-hydroxymuconate isomerase
MPHLVILYTANLDAESDMTVLCRTMADAMLGVKDEAGQPVFPTGGTRVFAYPAPHSAVADGQHDYAFAYFNVRMAQGRSDAVKKQAGDALLAAARAHFAPVFAKRYLGLTLQMDEGHEVFNGIASTIHPLFKKP